MDGTYPESNVDDIYSDSDVDDTYGVVHQPKEDDLPDEGLDEVIEEPPVKGSYLLTPAIWVQRILKKGFPYFEPLDMGIPSSASTAVGGAEYCHIFALVSDPLHGAI